MSWVFAEEKLDSYLRDAAGLWIEHYEELGRRDLVMDLDIPTFQSLEDLDCLCIVTARKDGVLKGYVIMIIRRHLHYHLICAMEDAYFLTKSERSFGIGKKMIEASLDFAKARGAEMAMFHSKVFESHRKLFAAEGFEQLDEIWVRKI